MKIEIFKEFNWFNGKEERNKERKNEKYGLLKNTKSIYIIPTT
jgi:hypothetical protein